MPNAWFNKVKTSLHNHFQCYEYLHRTHEYVNVNVNTEVHVMIQQNLTT